MTEIDPKIIKNMITHYSGLMTTGTKDFGEDFMSQSIFKDIDTNSDGMISQAEIKAAKPNLEASIKKVLAQDSFYAELHFGEEYTEELKKTNKNSKETQSSQIVRNNLNKAASMILSYAKEHPDDETVQKYANKLTEIINNNNLKLTDIQTSGVSGQAHKNDDGTDTILIDNHDSMYNLSVDYLLETLLHELRHTMEKDAVNSKAEEIEAEQTARDLQKKISGAPIFKAPISQFSRGYVGYAEASPGTYNIPQNTGIAVWYKPTDVNMNENNELVIKSDLQKKLGNVYIEDHVQFGTEKDEQGDSFPISAKCIIKDINGNVIKEYDYGEYDKQKRKFNYFKVHNRQIGLYMENNIDNMFNDFGNSN